MPANTTVPAELNGTILRGWPHFISVTGSRKDYGTVITVGLRFANCCWLFLFSLRIRNMNYVTSG